MRSLGLAAAVSAAAWSAIAVATTGGLAADLPASIYKAPVAPVVPPFSWAGFFVGAHGGYAWATEGSSQDDSLISSSLDPKSGFGGGQLGYNTYLTGKWVVGYVLDLSASDIATSGAAFAPSAVTASSKIDYFGTARARFGYGLDRLLPYVTVGTAWIHDSFNETVAATGVETFGRDQFYLGWTAGAGVEYAFNSNWSVFAEYQHADLGKSYDTIFPTGVRFTDLQLNLISLGINYRIGGSAPPVTAPAYPLKAAAPLATVWSGTYLGVEGGYGWARTNVADAALGQVSSLDPSGLYGGIETGYNWQMGPGLFGLVSETSYGNLTSSAVTTPGAFAAGSKIDWFGSERGRIGGFAGSSVLYYGTGGLAWAHYQFNDTVPAVGATGAGVDNYRVGWAAGAGLEWAFAPLWSAKVEYLHSDFGTYDDVVFGATRTASLTLDTVKVGVDWHGDMLAVLGSVVHLQP
jgi:outer membrane immunogenic protein